MRGKKILTAILLVSGMLCGCSGQEETTGTPLPVLNENGREEIRLSATSLDLTMQELIVDYNKQSERYEIVYEAFDRDTSWDDQRRRIQLELTGGGGPDILHYTALQNIDMRPYAEAGVFLDVTDFLIGQEEFAKNVAQANQIGDRIYGIPYTFSLSTLVTSPMMATDRENWTMEYCMQTAQEKGSQVFIKAPYGWTREESGLCVMDVLGVGIGDIQPFVDEEQGISSFEQPEFIELLEFSKEYWDSDPEASGKGKYASGEIFCTAMGIGNFDDFWYCEELFEGEPVYMGYPSPQGGQYQISVESFYINAASPHAEGALDFLQYLLAEEQQRRLVTGYGGFPVKQELLETLWKEAKEELVKEIRYEKGDLAYGARLMTDEEERIFWEMLEHPIYWHWQNDIWDIVQEEALPFFYGEKSAEEVADVIDGRVQIYLDESAK